MKEKIISFSIVFTCLFLFGCGQPKPDGLPKLVDVTLKFTQNEMPLVEASVSLYGTEDSAGFRIGGTTDKNGTVVLHTHGKYKGAPKGKYKIRIMKTETDPAPSMPKAGTPEFSAYIQQLKKNPPKTYTLVEKQYTDLKTTPLEIEITGRMSSKYDVGNVVREVL